MRLHRLALFLASALAFSVSAQTNPPIEQVRRLYDASPVSETNPVLATVKECNIEIPVSEFRAFVSFDTPPGNEGKILTPEEKRRELQKLLDDHFWVWQGYSKNADRLPEIAGLVGITRNEAMKALLIQQEADAKAASFAEYEQLKKELCRRVFEKAEIHVSSKAYDLLKAAAKRVNEADAKAGTNEVKEAADGLSPEDRELPLATCKAGTVRIGNLLQAYRQMPVAGRPDLGKQEVLSDILRDALTDGLLLVEAQERGLDKSELVRTQVQSDRTGLVRQWALDEITKKAVEAMKAPDLESQLKRWYDAHLKTLYTTRSADGTELVLDFKKGHEAIQDDYFTDLQERMRREELQKMRQGRNIQIDEKLLDKTFVLWRLPYLETKLAGSDVAWDGDSRDYVVRAGETNANFVFALTNISSGHLVIEDIHPVNEFITVQSPSLPWDLAPGERGRLDVSVDLRNKVGAGHSPIYVISSMGNKTLMLNITYPDKPITGLPEK